MKTPLSKQVRYLLEALLIYVFYFFFKSFKIETSSILGGKIVRFFSRILKENKVMEKNMELCFPSLDVDNRKGLALATWQHFGSIIGELPHWHDMPRDEFLDRVKIINPQNIPRSKALIISGHIGNWELISKIAKEYGIDLSLVYRPSNNHYANRLINKIRGSYDVSLIPKGVAGVREVVKDLKNNKVIGLMVDQKMSDGISVPFFKKDVMTTALPATLALKYGAPIVMTKIIKTGDARYNAEFCKPLEITPQDTKYSIMKEVNAALEEWIKESPEQWFWFHNRWGN